MDQVDSHMLTGACLRIRLLDQSLAPTISLFTIRGSVIHICMFLVTHERIYTFVCSNQLSEVAKESRLLIRCDDAQQNHWHTKYAVHILNVVVELGFTCCQLKNRLHEHPHSNMSRSCRCG